MFKKILKNITTKRLRYSIQNVITEFKIYLIHCKGLHRAHYFLNKNDLKLHLGCGSNIKKGFINIDLSKGADLRLDLRERLPFSINSCLIIYSEHFLEHLDYPDQAIFFMKESYRILKPGGVFSVGVPDTEWVILAYAEQLFPDSFPYPIENKYFAKWGERYSAWFQWGEKKGWHPNCVTKMEHLNYHFRQGTRHRFAYDFETLKYILELAGFGEVKRRDFDPELDSEGRKIGTLYVEAIKPNIT